jgi:hypothetical protein
MICQEFYKHVGFSETSVLSRSHRVKFNRFVFETHFKPRMQYCELNNFKIELSDSDLTFLTKFSERKVEAKDKEWKGIDSKFRGKREMTGACIEYGLLKFFGKESQFDDSIVDKSYKRNHPDLLSSGVICDIKGSSLKNVPLVFKSSRTYACNVGNHKGKRYRCANVIGITDQKSVWLLGIASPKILEDYVDDNLVMFAENTSKTGFYGVNKLEDLPNNWQQFKRVCTEKSLIL